MWFRLIARASRARPDLFVVALFGVILAATAAPCRGTSAAVCHALGIVAIVTLFFLQGARLSRAAILNGITCWRLHATIATTTFVLFPLTGLALSAAFPTPLSPLLWMGVFFLCALPSTVQSSIALTSIANGNVAGAICSATASNVAGIALTPLIFGALSRVHGGGVSLDGVGPVFCELLVPFIAGHLLRPRIGGWVESHRRVLSFTDRGSILLVVYGAFSAAVVHGVWHQLPPTVLLPLTLIVALILAIVLVGINLASMTLGFGRQDTVAAMFCGSQKSLVSGVPIASALFSAAAVGSLLIPIMIYYPMQLVVCAWLARRYAVAPNAALAARLDPESRAIRGSYPTEPTSATRDLSLPCSREGKRRMLAIARAASAHAVRRLRVESSSPLEPSSRGIAIAAFERDRRTIRTIPVGSLKPPGSSCGCRRPAT